ncbi:M16 family metallopeptidase [Natronospora cellulosivora (SeqCode)]
MKKYKLFISILVIHLILVFSVIAEVEFTEELFFELADSVNEIPFIETPDYTRVELDNGMIIYLAEDNDLPIIELRGYIKGGMSQENEGNAGISSVMVGMMNTGTKNYTENELTRFKELNALSFSISSSYDRYSFSGNSLSTEEDELISLMAEILRNPQFEADYYHRIIQEYFQGLQQQFFNDSSLLNMYFATGLYGDHPYAYNNDINRIIAALQSLTPDDLDEFYKQNIDPGNMILAISGDIDIKEMTELIKEHFADWESQEIELKENEIAVNEENFNKIVLVHKEDATHAKMMMGYNFYNSYFENRVPFLMANRVFGSSGFSSRLMDNLRTNKGYVYGIGSGMDYRQLGGLFYITTDVAPENAHDTMEAIKSEIYAIKEGENPITEDELFRNVNLYNAHYPKSYRNQISVLTDIMFNVEIMDRDEDYINQFIAEYNDLTAERVQEVFDEHTYPERFFTVIVANKNDVLPVFEEREIEVELIEIF